MAYKQREHYRVPLSAEAILNLGGRRFVQATCQNISMGGMGLSLDEDVDEKTPGKIHMNYEQGGGSIAFSAEFSVAWTRTQTPDVPTKHAGIQFTQLDDENKNRLVQIIIKRLEELEKDSPGTPQA